GGERAQRAHQKSGPGKKNQTPAPPGGETRGAKAREIVRTYLGVLVAEATTRARDSGTEPRRGAGKHPPPTSRETVGSARLGATQHNALQKLNHARPHRARQSPRSPPEARIVRCRAAPSRKIAGRNGASVSQSFILGWL